MKRRWNMGRFRNTDLRTALSAVLRQDREEFEAAARAAKSRGDADEEYRLKRLAGDLVCLSLDMYKGLKM